MNKKPTPDLPEPTPDLPEPTPDLPETTPDLPETTPDLPDNPTYPTCLGFHELQSAFGECKSSLTRLRSDIISVLQRFNEEIVESSIGGDISVISIDKVSGLLNTPIGAPVTFSGYYRVKGYNLSTDSHTPSPVTISLWYKDGRLHRNGGFSAVTLSRNNVILYQETWKCGKCKLHLPHVSDLEIKKGVPHPRRPNRI
jgi:hypothetical protein